MNENEYFEILDEEYRNRVVRKAPIECRHLMSTSPMCDACDRYKECQSKAQEYHETQQGW